MTGSKNDRRKCRRIGWRRITTAFALLSIGTLSACVAPVGPVEVTRFHAAQTATLGKGLIAIQPADGVDPASLEYRDYAAAAARELTRIGYREPLPGEKADGQVAVLDLSRRTFTPERTRNAVTVGGGGAAGTYGSGVGVGVSFDLSGAPKPQVETSMRVSIRERADGKVLWEGRASFTVLSSSPLAQTGLGSAKLAEALFKDFPGNSGETILVR